MTIGKNPAVLINILTFLIYSPISHAEQWNLELLMRNFEKTEQRISKFVEEKHFSILEHSLHLEGVLQYRAPNYLKKQVLRPHPHSFEIIGDIILIREKFQDEQRIQLQDHPLIQAFVESFRATLAGDLVKLRRVYRTELSGTSQNWLLKLTPIERAMSVHINSVELQGSEYRIEQIIINETGGDYSVMTITGETH